MSISLPNRIDSIVRFILVNVLRNILGIIRSKIVAIYYGVAEVGILGQFISFFNLQNKLVLFGTSASIINSYNLIDEKETNKESILLINLLIIFIANILNSLVIFIFINWLAILIFGNVIYKTLIILALVLNIVYSLSTFFEIVLQARKDFKLLSFGRGFAITISILAAIPLSYFYSVTGIIIDLILLYSVSFFYFCTKLKCIKYIKEINLTFVISKITRQNIYYISKIALTDLFRTVFILGGLFIVRILILNIFDIRTSGLYQALISISNYVNVLAEGFIVYYFPTISSSNEESIIKQEINTNFEILLYIITPLILILLFFSKYVLYLLYSSSFVQLSNELSWLIMAKLFYFFYYFYSISLLARNLLKTFLFLEAFRSGILIFLTYILSKYFGFDGAVVAIIITELLSVIMVVAFSWEIKYFHLDTSRYKKFFGVILMCLIAITPLIHILIKLFIICFLFNWILGVKNYINIVKKFIGNYI